MHLADTENAHLCVGASACAHVFASATHGPVSTWAHIHMWPSLYGVHTFVDTFAFCVCVDA